VSGAFLATSSSTNSQLYGWYAGFSTLFAADAHEEDDNEELEQNPEVP
jgi:hypothetical protein